MKFVDYDSILSENSNISQRHHNSNFVYTRISFKSKPMQLVKSDILWSFTSVINTKNYFFMGFFHTLTFIFNKILTSIY